MEPKYLQFPKCVKFHEHYFLFIQMGFLGLRRDAGWLRGEATPGRQKRMTRQHLWPHVAPLFA